MAKKHSVQLKEEKCEGCTNCVKNCPTRAIRVHQGQASIIDDLCIDCAECIRTCEYDAKYTRAHQLEYIKDYDYPVLLIPPSFYGQFSHFYDPDILYQSIYDLGFNEIYNVSRSAEALSAKTAKFLKQADNYYISSSCPVTVRLIQKIYPELIEHLLPFKSPVESTAQQARKELIRNNDISGDEIGLFFLTPCPAKLTSLELALGQKASYLDGVLAVNDIYEKILPVIKQQKNNDKQKTHTKQKDKSAAQIKQNEVFDQGIKWGQSGGEEKLLGSFQEHRVLSVSGIKEIQKVLSELVHSNISGIKYFELVSCPQGCVGGVLNVCNSFQAKFNIRTAAKENNQKIITPDQKGEEYDFSLDRPFRSDQRGKLDPDMDRALDKLSRLEEEKDLLPGLDCASCGAPDCETLAEDIVQGKAQRTDCIFMLRQEVQNLAEQISNLARELPPVMSEEKMFKDAYGVHSGDELDQTKGDYNEG